jgi:hypothetical protein
MSNENVSYDTTSFSMLGAIDPGLSGALVIVDHAGALVALADTPTLALHIARGTRHDYDVPGMVALVVPYAGLHVVIEASQPMPGQGTRSMFTIGYGYGLWLGILAALQVPYTPVRPAVWKKAVGLGKDKEQARLRAQQLFPTADLRRKKDHGRAEALLLAWWGWSHRATASGGGGLGGHVLMVRTTTKGGRGAGWRQTKH